jgi:hypothetical protein
MTPPSASASAPASPDSGRAPAKAAPAPAPAPAHSNGVASGTITPRAATAPAKAPAAAQPPLVPARPKNVTGAAAAAAAAAAVPAPPPAAPAAAAAAPAVAAAVPAPPAAVAPPPAPKPAARPPAPTLAVPVPVKESAAGSLDLVIAMAIGEAPVVTVPSSTASDQAALLATFEDLAVPHVAQVRSAMMEVQWGEAQLSWLELAQPALKSLRRMASEVGNTTLADALEGFVAAMQKVLAPGQGGDLSAPARDTLIAAYAPLVECMPRAFELQGERERREPLVVRALLEQVPGLEPLMIDKMMGAGLGQITALFAARADEIAAVTAIPADVAAATAARVQAFRRSSPAALATIDPGATLRELSVVLEQLRAAHIAFEAAARGWSEADRQSKKQLRWQRQVLFLQITIGLVQLGEFDLALRLPKLAFARSIDELDQLLIRMATTMQKKADRNMERSGPHPAAA